MDRVQYHLIELINCLLQKGFEVGFLAAVRDCEVDRLKNCAYWFVVRENRVWWSDLEAHRPVIFSFRDGQPTREGVFKTHRTHDPVHWAVFTLMEDLNDNEIELSRDIQVVVRVDDDIIDHSELPPGCTAASVRTFLAFKRRHEQMPSLPKVPDIRTLRDVILANHPIVLRDAVQHELLDAVDAYRWQPMSSAASRAFRVD